MTSATKWRPLFAAVLCAAAVSRLAPAAALEHIDGESWQARVVPGAPATGPIGLVFDAKLTPMDVRYGLRFKIVTRESGRPSQTFADWYYVGVRGLPPAGSTVRFDLTLTLDCLPGASSVVGAGEGWIVWDAGGGQTRFPISSSRTPAVATSGRFGLALIDEYGVPGPHPMPEQAMSCTDDRPRPTIGIYFDPQGTMCQGTIRPGVPGKIYILAKLTGMASGTAGAEFRITGIPESWEVYPVAHPEALAVGDPFGNGVSMGFTCQTPPSGVFQLYEVVVQATAEESDLEFGIESRKYRDHVGFCPFVMRCNDPYFTKLCVEAKSCFVNATVPKPCVGPVAVTDRTWSQVKAIYR